MKIYTRTGDRGETSLFGGERVQKDSARIRAYGTLDELNSALGVAASQCVVPRVGEIIETIQRQLLIAGSDLSTRADHHPPIARIREEEWRNLEQVIDQLQGELPPLKHFILPGGTPGAALLHLARTICRRAERLAVNASKQGEELNHDLMVYINRLSDLLFVLARFENLNAGGEEKVWTGRG